MTSSDAHWKEQKADNHSSSVSILNEEVTVYPLPFLHGLENLYQVILSTLGNMYALFCYKSLKSLCFGVENNWHSSRAPVLPRGLNSGHMSAVRAISPLKNSLGSAPKFSALICAPSFIPSPLAFISHFSTRGGRFLWAVKAGIACGCWGSQSPLQGSHFHLGGAPTFHGLQLNWAQALAHGDALRYRLSLRASQRPLLSEGIRREHLHTR